MIVSHRHISLSFVGEGAPHIPNPNLAGKSARDQHDIGTGGRGAAADDYSQSKVSAQFVSCTYIQLVAKMVN